MDKVDAQVSAEQDERKRELAERVLKATFDQLHDQINDDLAKVRQSFPSANAQAVETAMDMKYIRDRQKRLDSKND